MPDFSLPKPTDLLAGCIWLPRFAGKVKLHAAGTLEGDYLLAFCHPRGIDGYFLRHFELEKEQALSAILRATSNGDLERWFTSLTTATETSIAAWNEFAPQIGRSGHPGERELAFMLRRTYADKAPPFTLTSSFNAILWDEHGWIPDEEHGKGSQGSSNTGSIT